MTDTVNVPREAVEEFRKWYEMDRGRAILKGKARKIVARILLAAAPKAEPVQSLVDFDVESYVDVYELRSDEGDYTPNEKERMLITDAIHGVISELCISQPEAPKVERGPVGDGALKVAKDIHVALEKLIYGLPDYLASENLTDEENVIRDAQIALDVTAHRLAHIELAHPAPASDELMEALRELLGRAEEVRNMLNAHPLMQGREHVSMGVALNKAIGRGQRAYDAQHKGPQS